jgi:hypothetical protein
MKLESSPSERRDERAPSSGAIAKEESLSPYGNQHNVVLKGTRKGTLDAIRDWAGDPSATKWIFCLEDAAGMGKSTVAKRMDEEWKKQEQEGQKPLVARFFFSRNSTDTISTRKFCSTVATAFSVGNKDFEAELSNSKKNHQDWEALSFKEQFKALLVDPLEKLGRAAILTIDALDECDDEGRQQLSDILGQQEPPIRYFRILVTRRPILDTKDWSKQSWVECKDFHQLEGNNNDVETYIRDRFQRQLNDTRGSNQSRAQALEQLDKDGSLDRIIERAEDLFIWAKIACDLFVTFDNIGGLPAKLESLERYNDKLPTIYTVALEQAAAGDEGTQREILQVLQMVLAARRPLSVAELEKISPWSGMGVVERIITRLGSLLRRQSHDDPIQLLHTTVREFLTDQERAGDFYIKVKYGHYTLASGSLSIIRGSTPDQRGGIQFGLESLLILYPGFLITHHARGHTTVQFRGGSFFSISKFRSLWMMGLKSG